MKICSSTLLLACVTVYLTGCVTTGQLVTDISPEKISTEKKIGVVWLSPCSGLTGCDDTGEGSNQAEFVPDGAQGLLVMGAILSAHEEVREALKSVTADSVVTQHYTGPVSNTLQARGVRSSTREAYNYFGHLEKKERHKIVRLKTRLKTMYPEHSRLFHGFGFEHALDFSGLAESMGVEMLVVLEVQQFGIRRDFGPFGIPVGKPYALSLVRLYMTDMTTGDLLFSDFGVSETTVGEEWREPDNWTQIKNAATRSLEQAIDNVTSRFVQSLAASS